MNLEKTINSSAFQSCLQTTEHLMPFSSNPKIDEAYRTLRLLGFPAKESGEMINNEINRRINLK